MNPAISLSPSAPSLMHVGVGAWVLHAQCTARDYAEQGALAEELGFHSFWLPENHFGDHTTLPSPLLVLSAVAARTECLRLGTGSYLLPHPSSITGGRGGGASGLYVSRAGNSWDRPRVPKRHVSGFWSIYQGETSAF